MFQAWLTFAVFDNARRARLGTALDDYRTGIGEMLSPMTAIAAHNPHAWYRIERTVADIVEPRPDNRMVGYPYTKYMVSVMDVDMAGALVVATHERADALGVPADKRVYPRGWCYARDPVLVAEHPDMSRSPAMGAAAAEAFRVAGMTVDDIAYFDLYSCFASSLHFACDALGLRVDDPRGVTVTGGLPYHGGPASGYLTHSIAAMVERLRARPAGGRPGQRGRHAHDEARVRRLLRHSRARLCRPARTRPKPRPARRALPVWFRSTKVTRRVGAYSVVHGRDGEPEWALLVCDLADGARTYAQVRTPELCDQAEQTELVGRSVTLAPRTVEGPAGTVRVNHATW